MRGEITKQQQQLKRKKFKIHQQEKKGTGPMLGHQTADSLLDWRNGASGIVNKPSFLFGSLVDPFFHTQHSIYYSILLL
jgi:hypothetical protein